MTYKIGSADVTSSLVSKSYFFDLYPSLSGLFKTPALWGWGNNSYGQLGDNTYTHRSSPTFNSSAGSSWATVSNGSSHVVALKVDGTLWTWGDNIYGQLGNNSSTVRLTPVQTVDGGSTWSRISAGTSISAGIKDDGTLWVWGLNTVGALGTNNRTSRSSPVQTVAGGTNWKQIECGSGSMAAIKTDGTLWTWGQNTYGQLGNNSVSDRSSPVQTIAGGTNWKQVACGALYHMAAIKSDGTLWTWGYNFYGQLGLGNNSYSAVSSPVQTIAGGTDWKQVSVGRYNTAAIKTNGTLWSWGYNFYGQLGDNTTTDKSSPVQTVAGGTNWKSLADPNQSLSAFAIKTDGTLWGWGRNSSGELGDNTMTNRSSPIQTVTGGTNWKSVSTNSSITIAIAEDNPFL